MFHRVLRCFLFSIVCWPTCAAQLIAQEKQEIRVGVIGLDTSHAPAFAKALNDESATGPAAQVQVTVAFPGGSADIPSSIGRVAGYTEEFKSMGIKIVDSIDTLLAECDCVLLESLDGRKHVEQVLPVFQAGKPVFIDKPLAANLSEAIVIDLLAKHYEVPWFSCSSLRFGPSIYRWRSDATLHASVQGATAWSPCEINEFHTDLFWYGIHGVEPLYTVLGSGCQTVTRTHTANTDVVVGTWQDGRIGTFRGLRSGRKDYGILVFADESIDASAKFEGYGPLVDKIAEFFVTKEAPIDSAETIELMTFMEAADVSLERGSIPVSLDEVFQAAKKTAQAQVDILVKQ